MSKLSSSIVRFYYLLRYPKARDLQRKKIPFEHYRELNKSWMTGTGVKTVLDVGANTGQFAKLAREVFPEAVIYSFEPLPDCYEKLQHALPGDENFHPFNNAIGSSLSTLQFFRSVHSPSSSFLQMEDLHKQAFPESRNGQEQEPVLVKVDTLDNFFDSKKPAGTILLKVDVQGFEKEVIAGATEMLKRVKIVVMEISFLKLYKDQPLFHDIYTRMVELGFRYHGNLAQMLHPGTGEVVQADSIFVRED